MVNLGIIAERQIKEYLPMIDFDEDLWLEGTQYNLSDLQNKRIINMTVDFDKNEIIDTLG